MADVAPAAPAPRPVTRLSALIGAPPVVSAPSTRAHCPRCGRRVGTERLVDITALPAPVRAAAGWAGAYACDGCLHVARILGHLTHEALVVAHGAPADVVLRARALDAAERRVAFGVVVRG